MKFNFFKRNKESKNNMIKTFKTSFDGIIGRDSTSFAAIDLIASSFANLTGHFYYSDSKKMLEYYYLNDLLHEPNIDETKFQFFYNSVKDYFNGNCYWYKYYDGRNIVSLFRLNPNSVIVSRNSFNQKIFTYLGKEYTAENIIHIPSRYGYDGLIGKSIFSECNSIFTNASELDTYINNSFNNSIGNRLVIDITKEYPNASEEQINQLKQKFLQNYTGIKNAGKPLIKSGKIDYTKIETDLKDNKSNQLIENREFQEKEIAKLFGVPLPLLQGTETANLESLYTIFIENAIRPIATSFEQAINKLIEINDKYGIYFEFSYNSLMKTSLQTRIDSYTKQLNNGILSPNEIRRKENLSAIEAGDNHFIPGNLMPLNNSTVDAYMASAKLKNAELNTYSPNINGKHSSLGDDKGM